MASGMGIVKSGSAAAKRIVRSSGIEEAELAPEIVVSMIGTCYFQSLWESRCQKTVPRLSRWCCRLWCCSNDVSATRCNVLYTALWLFAG